MFPGLELLEKHEQNMSNCPHSLKQMVTLEQTAAYVKPAETSYVAKPPTAQRPHNSKLPPIYKLTVPTFHAGAFLQPSPFPPLESESTSPSAFSSLCYFFHCLCKRPP